MDRRSVRVALFTLAMLVFAGMVACGGEVNLACDEPRPYQEAVDGEGLKAPEDLDSLEPLREMPLPEANPRPERAKGSPCLDLPPRISPTN